MMAETPELSAYFGSGQTLRPISALFTPSGAELVAGVLLKDQQRLRQTWLSTFSAGYRGLQRPRFKILVNSGGYILVFRHGFRRFFIVNDLVQVQVCILGSTVVR
jgi:hypothetical protein